MCNGTGLLAASRAELVSHIAERLIGVAADVRNRGQADDDDQRQHHGVLDCSRAIFRYEETLHLQSETLHHFLQILVRPSVVVYQD